MNSKNTIENPSSNQKRGTSWLEKIKDIFRINSTQDAVDTIQQPPAEQPMSAEQKWLTDLLARQLTDRHMYSSEQFITTRNRNK